ncbi:NUDIX domain-containing protein [Streptomyces sp. NPDC058316]|uniref:NUDIX domain-containing protein n=1 Tax=unclassified Streptomyces TaxID=2593676 RepID=UPI00332DCC44
MPLARFGCDRQKSANPPPSPGGKVEPGETPRAAAARELAEETGRPPNCCPSPPPSPRVLWIVEDIV